MTRWLSPEEQADWRKWLNVQNLLSDRLNRELVAEHNISLADYAVLVTLSENAEHRMRMSDLADALFSSRSRLSHQISRMEQDGWVMREKCPDDRRGQFATLTPHGLATLEAAAPTHVEGVRRHLLDHMSEAEFAQLGAIVAPVIDSLSTLRQQRPQRPPK